MDEQITGKGTATEPNPQFLAWMQEFRIGDDDKSQVRRWTAVNSISANADENDLEALIRIALASRQVPMRAQQDKIVQAFQTSDPPFSPQLNGRELQVLAASCLVHIAQSENETLASIAALLISTAFFGWRPHCELADGPAWLRQAQTSGVIG
jgi:GTPase-associated system helical domain